MSGARSGSSTEDTAQVRALRERFLKDYTTQMLATELIVATLLSIFTEHPWFVYMPWVFPPMTAAVPFVFKRTGSLAVAANFVNVPVFVLSMVGMVLTGGLGGLTPSVFVTLPLVALILGGTRLALLWVALPLAWMVALAIWEAISPFQSTLLEPRTMDWVNFAITATIVWGTFDLARRYDDLRRAVQEDLTGTNERLAGLLAELEGAATRLEAGAQRLRGGRDGEGLLVRLRRTASEGRNALLENRSGLADLIAQVGVVSDTVAAFHDNAQSVADLLGSIQRISGRLDLMALNMGIEASKAGEAGAPFSILARDMRRLAERVRDDSLRIRSKIHELEQRSADAVDASAAGEALRQRGSSNSDAIAATFDEVCAMVEEAADAGIGLSDDTLGHLAKLQRGLRESVG